MTLSTSAHLEELGARIAVRLGPDWQFLKSCKQLRRSRCGGHDIIVFDAMTQFSPAMLISFHFGRHFEVATQANKLIGRLTPYEIHQNVRNLRHMAGLEYGGAVEWQVDARENLPGDLVSGFCDAVEAVAVPFLERFDDPLTARDALVADDSWVLIGGPLAWQSILVIDVGLGDLRHFEGWAPTLDGDRRALADGALALVRGAT